MKEACVCLPLVLAEAPNITSTVCWFNWLERNVLSNLCFCSVPYARRSPLSAVLLLLLPAAGIAFFYGGMVQSKNVVSTIMQAFLPLAIIPVVWSTVGCASNSTTCTAARSLRLSSGTAQSACQLLHVACCCHILQPVTKITLSFHQCAQLQLLPWPSKLAAREPHHI
jgi:hypothetical protein